MTAAGVAALVEAFRQTGRRPRLKYVTSRAPGLETLLPGAGFTVEARHDYRGHGPGLIHRPRPGPGVRARVAPRGTGIGGGARSLQPT